MTSDDARTNQANNHVEVKGPIHVSNLDRIYGPLNIGGIMLVQNNVVFQHEGRKLESDRLCRIFISSAEVHISEFYKQLENSGRFQLMPMDPPLNPTELDYHWSRKLLLQMGQCNGGILFLNKDNIYRQDSFQIARLLRWMKWRVKSDFTPLIVCLDSEAETAVQGILWSPLLTDELTILQCCDEIQNLIERHFAYTNSRITPVHDLKDFIDQILLRDQENGYINSNILLETLEEILGNSSNTFLPRSNNTEQNYDDYLTLLLRSPIKWLEKMRGELGYPDDIELSINETLRCLLTLEIMYQGLYAWQVIKERLRRISLYSRDSLKQLLAPIWANPYITAQLPFIITNPNSSDRAAFFRTKRAKSVNMHMLAARYEPTRDYGFILKHPFDIRNPAEIFDYRDDWILINATRGNSQDDIKYTIDEIKSALSRLYNPMSYINQKLLTDSQLLEKIEIYKAELVVILPTSGDDKYFLEELRDQWPLCVNFTFCFFGNDFPEEFTTTHLFDIDSSIEEFVFSLYEKLEYLAPGHYDGHELQKVV